MSYSKRRLKEVVALQRAVLDRIEADLGEFGSSPSGKYIQEFNDEFLEYDAVCTAGEILNAAVDADLVWIGDYHALPQAQTFAAGFLRQIASRKSGNIALGVEMVFACHQKILDRWMHSEISESEFLEQIRYSEEWGCDWPSYRALFDAARGLEIPVYGIDFQPRRDMRSIGRRDQKVARRIAQLRKKDPSRTLVVLFGESHLASVHLPRRVNHLLRKADALHRDVLVLQNVDSLYWALQRQGLEGLQSVRIQPRQYCVFNATPVEKYESFRQYLLRCAEGGTEDDGGSDWSRFVHSLIDAICDFLEIEKHPGMMDYVPNSMFVDDFRLNHATEETARFIHQWCRGEVQNSTQRGTADVFYITILERALGYFFSKLLDSSRDGIESLGERVLQHIGYNDELVRTVRCLLDPERRPSSQHFEQLRATVEQWSNRSKMLPLLAQVLGYALGRRLYRAYLESRISRKEIQALLHDPLEAPHRPIECYVELSTRLS